MKREEFSDLVATTLKNVVALAERECGRKLSGSPAFQWLGDSGRTVRENLVEHIVDRVFVDEEHIFPCVDIGVAVGGPFLNKIAGRDDHWQAGAPLAYLVPDQREKPWLECAGENAHLSAETARIDRIVEDEFEHFEDDDVASA